MRPFGRCTSMCDPAENGGNGRPPISINSKLTMSGASRCLRATRTLNSALMVASGRGRRGALRLLGRDDAVEHLARLHAAQVDVELEELPRRMGQEVPLLQLEHLPILGEDLALAFA